MLIQPRFRNNSPINAFRLGARKTPDRSRNHRRSPSRQRNQLSKQPRRSEICRVQHRSPSPTNCARNTQWACLGVFGMSYQTTENDLRRIFQRYGPIMRVNLVHNPVTRQSRGFGFVYFRHKKDAMNARDRCNGMLFDKRNIRVALSRTEKPHTPTPGQYMGSENRSEHERFVELIISMGNTCQHIF